MGAQNWRQTKSGDVFEEGFDIIQPQRAYDLVLFHKRGEIMNWLQSSSFSWTMDAELSQVDLLRQYSHGDSSLGCMQACTHDE